MTDKELLEFAAKAAGMKDAKWDDFYNCISITGENGLKDCPWNPLESDGYALGLAFKLRIDIEFNYSNVNAHLNKPGFGYTAEERIKNSDTSSTRRAIVRAAAELGKALP